LGALTITNREGSSDFIGEPPCPVKVFTAGPQRRSASTYFLPILSARSHQRVTSTPITVV
jgi:hypothetical protein